MRIFLFFLTALITVAVAACGGVSEQAPTPSRPAPTSIPTVIAEPATEGAVAQPGAPTPTAVNTASKNVGSAGEVTGSGLTQGQQALMAQVLASPDLMVCLTGAVGMQTLMELADRSPTNEETTLLQSCLDAEEDRALALSSEEPILASGETDSQEEAAGSKLVVEQPNSDDPDENPAESFFARFMNAQM